MFKFAFRNERIYNYVLDTNGNAVQYYVQNKENRPLEFLQDYLFDSIYKLTKITGLIYTETDKPEVLRTISPDTSFTTSKYNEKGPKITETTYPNNKLASNNISYPKQASSRNVSYVNKSDFILTEIKYNYWQNLQSIHTFYYVPNVKYSRMVNNLFYKYSKGRIKKLVYEKKFYMDYTKQPLINSDVHFYSYFKNKFLKKITSKMMQDVSFKYEYF